MRFWGFIYFNTYAMSRRAAEAAASGASAMARYVLPSFQEVEPMQIWRFFDTIPHL